MARKKVPVLAAALRRKGAFGFLHTEPAASLASLKRPSTGPWRSLCTTGFGEENDYRSLLAEVAARSFTLASTRARRGGASGMAEAARIAPR